MDEQNLIIYKTEDGKASVALYARDGNVCLNQNQLAELFSTSKQNISAHILNILEERELDEFSVVKDFLTTAIHQKCLRMVGSIVHVYFVLLKRILHQFAGLS